MKRLTGRAPDGTAYLYNMGGTNAAIDRLAAYEDTGLEPEEIYKLCEMEKRTRMAKMIRLEQAESEGRLLVLPCEVGDAVLDETTNHIFTVDRIEVGWPCGMMFRCGNPGTEDYMAFYASEIGEKIRILTREEAEAALRKEQS